MTATMFYHNSMAAHSLFDRRPDRAFHVIACMYRRQLRLVRRVVSLGVVETPRRDAESNRTSHLTPASDSRTLAHLCSISPACSGVPGVRGSVWAFFRRCRCFLPHNPVVCLHPPKRNL